MDREIRKARLNELRHKISVRKHIERNLAAPLLEPSLELQLKNITPRKEGMPLEKKNIYPCSIELKNGTIFPCAYMMSVSANDRWGWPLSIRKPEVIPLNDVLIVSSSPFRLPPLIAEQIKGESGMGYLRGIFRMLDGEEIPWVTTEIFDFPDLPKKYSVKDVISVELHTRNEVKEPIRTRPYVIVLFQGSDNVS